MGRAILIFLLSVLVGGSSSSPSESSPRLASAAQPSEALTFLDKSHSLLSSLDELDRIRFLNDLVVIAPEVAPERVAPWAQELITMAQSIRNPKFDDWDRIAFQKNAVVALSKIDPELAMQKFVEMGSPAPNSEGRLPEDVRAFGARVLYLNYFKAFGRRSLPTLQKQAARLASDGAYPFHAMSLVIGEVTPTGKEENTTGDELFADALNYYSCDSKVENQDAEFFTFLQNTEPVVSRPLFLKGLHEFAAHLTNPNCDRIPEVDQFLAIIKTPNGDIRLRDQRKALLFGAFSFLKKADQSFANQLQKSKDNYYLAGADAPITQIASGRFSKDVPAENEPEVEKSISSRFFVTGHTKHTRLESAGGARTHAIRRRPKKPFRAGRFRYSRFGRERSTASEGVGTFANSTELDLLPEGPQNIQASVWLAEAAFHMQDTENFQYLAAKVFDEGVNEFEQSYTTTKDSSDIPVDNRPGYTQLAEFDEFACAHNVRWPLDEINNMNDARLKAHLFMYAAKGIAKQRK